MNIDDMKELGQRLLNIVLDVDTGKEALAALETDDERMALKEKLVACPGLVTAEMFDAISQITNGRFVKDFVPARKAKQEYLKNKTDENLVKFMKCLYEDGVWTLYTWDLTPEEEKAFENAEVGDTIHIETPRLPGLLEDNNDDRLIIPAYTSELEIWKERMKEFDRQEINFRNLVNVMHIIKKKTGRDAAIIVDIDSDDEVEISEEIILKYEKLKQEENPTLQQDSDERESGKK